MKSSFLMLVFALGVLSCSSHSETSVLLPANISTGQVSSDTSSRVTFESDVLPILKTHCNPCHFPGGKLYEKLPFDQASTITGHAPGILKRIQDETEAATIRKFVEAFGNTSQ